MKKYVVLDQDLTDLLGQATSYLANKIDDPAYAIQLYHPVGYAVDLVDDLPAIGDPFGDTGLTFKGLGHHNIDNEVRPVPAKISMMVVPLQNTESTSFIIGVPKSGTSPYIDPMFEYEFYDPRDIDVVETFTVNPNQQVLLAEGTHYAIKNESSELAQFIILAFNEDITDYFAE